MWSSQLEETGNCVMYDLSLDRKPLVFIAVCCLVVGGLLFFAGTIVGLDRGSHETQARMEKEFSARLAAAKAAAPPEAAQSQPDDSGMAMSESPDPDPAPAVASSHSLSRPQLFSVAVTTR